MIKMKFLTLLVLFIFTSCSSEDEPNRTSEGPEEGSAEIKISPSRIRIGEIGDTIRITGKGLDAIKRVEMRYEGKTDDLDGSFEFGLSGGPFIKHTDEEIIIKPAYFPEYYREEITLFLKDADHKVVKKTQLKVYGVIPIKHNFSNVTHIKVISSQIAYVLDGNKSIYKSSDGYNEWTEIFSSGYHIAGVYFIDAQTGWIVVDEGNYTNIYITKDGGSTFNLYLPQDSLTHSVWNIQFTSVNRGYFNTDREAMFVIDNLEVIPFYEFFNDLDTSTLSSEDVFKFQAVNDNLIFIKPSNSESLVRISDNEILKIPFGEFYNMPEFFGDTGYFSPFWKKLYKSTDRGDSWEEIKEFENIYLNSGFLSADTGFAINSQYPDPTDIYFTNDGGISWIKYYTSAGRFDAGRLFDFNRNAGLFGDPRRLFKYVP